MNLTDIMLFGKSLIGGSGGSSGGGGSTVLKSYSHSAEPELPAGIFDPNHAYYKLWDNTPSLNDLVGAVFGITKAIDVISEDELVVVDSASGIIAWRSSSLSYAPMFVFTQDLSEDGVVFFSKGIYVVDNFCNSGLVVLAYNGDSGGSGSSGGATSNSKTGAAYYDVTYNTIGAELGLYLASRDIPDIRNGATGYLVNDDATGGIFDQVGTSKGTTIEFTAVQADTDWVFLVDGNENPVVAIALRDTIDGDAVIEKGVYTPVNDGLTFDTMSFYLCWTNP